MSITLPPLPGIPNAFALENPELVAYALSYARVDRAAVLRAVAHWLISDANAQRNWALSTVLAARAERLRAAADAITPTRERQDARGDAE